MIDTRTCCVGDLPQEIVSVRAENYKLKKVNKLILVTIAMASLLFATLIVLDQYQQIKKSAID